MRNVAIVVAGTLISGLVAFGGCSGGSGTGGTGSGGGPSGAGGGPANFTCNPPMPSPSKGSCVTFTPPPDGGPALDAGLDDADNASITTCNPVTNAGCRGTDTCGPDSSGANFFCQPAGTPANVPLCGKCSGAKATCVAGGICLSLDQSSLSCKSDSDCPQTVPYCDTMVGQCYDFFCGQTCCTDADCGPGATCDVMDLLLGPDKNVGICLVK